MINHQRGNPFYSNKRARCICGWISDLHTNKANANAQYEAHRKGDIQGELEVFWWAMRNLQAAGIGFEIVD